MVKKTNTDTYTPAWYARIKPNTVMLTPCECKEVLWRWPPLLIGVALIIVFQVIFIIIIQQPILKFPVDSAILAHVDNVIIIILIIVAVHVLNHLIFFKVGALAMAALIGGVRLTRVSQLFIASLLCWLGLAP